MTALHPFKIEIEEVDNFCYLGIHLDQNLNMDYALMKAVQSFWKGHKDTTDLDVKSGNIHPRVLVLLWRQLALSRLTHILPFLHTPQHYAQVQQAFQASLLLLFCRKARYKLIDLKAGWELRRPPATV
jgi:hypothetical protein